MADDPNEYSNITTGDLIEQLRGYPSDTPISFGYKGQFNFYRVKDRRSLDKQSGCVQIEFNEIHGSDVGEK